tara:strand:+ start:7072 stop:7815 length:744 start_codon:yes stop_codon:yes gene_type:complete
MIELSPKYLMNLITNIELAIKTEFKTPDDIIYYISKWHKSNGENYNDYWENFAMIYHQYGEFELNSTLHGIPTEELLKIAADLGVQTPEYIPTIATFKNEIKVDFNTAHSTFNKAVKLIETDPSTSIGLANSALESIIKEILKQDEISAKLKGGETLYQLAIIVLKEFKLSGNEMPKEIKTIGTSLVTISQSIEKLRSEKTEFHGKTNEDYLIKESIYAHLVINTVTTVGLFLLSFYKTKYPKVIET